MPSSQNMEFILTQCMLHTHSYAAFITAHLYYGIQSDYVRCSILINLAISEGKPWQQMAHRPHEAAWHSGIRGVCSGDLSFGMTTQIRWEHLLRFMPEKAQTNTQTFGYRWPAATSLFGIPLRCQGALCIRHILMLQNLSRQPHPSDMVAVLYRKSI